MLIFREANKPADRLANVGPHLQVDCTFDGFAMLPLMVCGDVILDRLGFPSFRSRAS